VHAQEDNCKALAIAALGEMPEPSRATAPELSHPCTNTNEDEAEADDDKDDDNDEDG